MRLTPSIAGNTPTFNPTIFGNSSVYLLRTDLKVDRTNIATLVISPTLSAITTLSQLDINWDGCGSARPSPAAIQRATVMVESFYRLVAANSKASGQWVDPHVSASEEGEVVLEWWNDAHKLTLYIGEKSAQYLRVWGTNISTQMDDGMIEGNHFQGLWLWLNA